MGEGGKAAKGQQWLPTGERRPRIIMTPLEMSKRAADRKAGIKPPKPLTEKQHLARRKENVAIQATMPAIASGDFNHYLRFGPSSALGTGG